MALRALIVVDGLAPDSSRSLPTTTSVPSFDFDIVSLGLVTEAAQITLGLALGIGSELRFKKSESAR